MICCEAPGPVASSRASVRRATFTRSSPLVGLAAGAALALAIASGAIAVPDVAGAASDATDSIMTGSTSLKPALVFVETTALAGFVIHGELALVAAAWRPSAVTRRWPSSSR